MELQAIEKTLTSLEMNNSELALKLKQYLELLFKWNKTHNLTAIKIYLKS